ncbi:MAG TPA: cupin domain-containing protein [Pirellulales bacterium]|jgi:50S ribosomal protein L16 3-hydroxylase|nr:cupin domain-containing protein [Pirellulales bacterium]
MAVARLLGSIPLSLFMEEHYQKLPFALAGGCADFQHLGSWDALEEIWQQDGLDLLASGSQGVWAGDDPKTNADARAMLAAGYTLGLRNTQKQLPALAELAADFQRDFLATIDVQIYCTPAGSPGFGWHYDFEDVFILQTVGCKDWWLRKNTVNPWPLKETLAPDMRYEAEIMPLVHCTLRAGDWLYIPAGYWHRTSASEESISLSIGVAAQTGLDVFDSLRRQLIDSMLWRQRFPAAGAANPMSDRELLGAYREQMRVLGEDLSRILADPKTARDFLAAQGRAIEP